MAGFACPSSLHSNVLDFLSLVHPPFSSCIVSRLHQALLNHLFLSSTGRQDRWSLLRVHPPQPPLLPSAQPNATPSYPPPPPGLLPPPPRAPLRLPHPAPGLVHGWAQRPHDYRLDFQPSVRVCVCVWWCLCVNPFPWSCSSRMLLSSPFLFLCRRTIPLCGLR